MLYLLLVIIANNLFLFLVFCKLEIWKCLLSEYYNNYLCEHYLVYYHHGDDHVILYQ